MKAVVFHGIGDIRLETVREPSLQEPTDAIVRLTASAICGTDLHMIRGTVSGMKAGTILGHEGVGIVEAVGPGVRNFQVGDRVVIPSTIACGYCSYCRDGYYSQCDHANPNGSRAGTAFFGGPASTGPFHGLQAELARVPFANVGLLKLPDEINDDQAITLSDIFPTGYFGAQLAEIRPGDLVVVFGCGPVGQFVITSAKLKDAGRVIAVDRIASRLDMAKGQGAEVIDCDKEDPVEAILEITGGIGADRVIDAVGVDAVKAQSGPAAKHESLYRSEYSDQVKAIAPKTNRKNGNWAPGDGPSQVLEWAVKSAAKAGTLAIIGVYPETMRWFPIGAAMNKNLTLHMGNCDHHAYVPKLIDLVRAGRVNPAQVLTHIEPFESVLNAYKAFDQRQPGWIKVELLLAGRARNGTHRVRSEQPVMAY